MNRYVFNLIFNWSSDAVMPYGLKSGRESVQAAVPRVFCKRLYGTTLGLVLADGSMSMAKSYRLDVYVAERVFMKDPIPVCRLHCSSQALLSPCLDGETAHGYKRRDDQTARSENRCVGIDTSCVDRNNWRTQTGYSVQA